MRYRNPDLGHSRSWSVTRDHAPTTSDRRYRDNVVGLPGIVGRDPIEPPVPTRNALMDQHNAFARSELRCDRRHEAAAGRRPVTGFVVDVLGI